MTDAEVSEIADPPEESGATGPRLRAAVAGAAALAARRGTPAWQEPARAQERARSAHLGRPVAVRQHRAHDRSARRSSSRSCWSSIVLISVMNVMMMAVYERIREIGTISAIGTPPRRILVPVSDRRPAARRWAAPRSAPRSASAVDLRAQRLEDHVSISAAAGPGAVARRSAPADRADRRGDGGHRGAAREPAAGVEGLAHGPGHRAAAMSD